MATVDPKDKAAANALISAAGTGKAPETNAGAPAEGVQKQESAGSGEPIKPNGEPAKEKPGPQQSGAPALAPGMQAVSTADFEAFQKFQAQQKSENEQAPTVTDQEFATFQQWRKDMAAASQVKQTPRQDPAPEAGSIDTTVKGSDAELTRRYGQGYVKAKREGIETVFTRLAWDALGQTKGRNGWQEIVKKPAELK
jgi:hypothetical protein